jgi:hypothetical protein
MTSAKAVADREKALKAAYEKAQRKLSMGNFSMQDIACRLSFDNIPRSQVERDFPFQAFAE